MPKYFPYLKLLKLKKKYNFIHVKSDFNTKFFGRFSYCFSIPADIFLIFDDDMIPGVKCVEKYVNSCLKLNAIIGGNGRYAQLNENRQKMLDRRPKPDYGLRRCMLVDFVGHLWCFKKDWLYYMFSTKPYTYDTGEDMHFCFSANVLTILIKQFSLLEYIRLYTIKCKDSTDFLTITPILAHFDVNLVWYFKFYSINHNVCISLGLFLTFYRKG